MEKSEQLNSCEIQSENKLKDGLQTAETTAIGNLIIQKDNTFSCNQCALSFVGQFEFALHLESNEHAVMVLASGFEKEETENEVDSLPPLYCCLLCNVWCFDYSNCACHFKSKIHEKVANHFKIMLIGDKELNVVDHRCSCESKKLSDPYLPLHYCGLCDNWCENCQTFNQHTQSKKHKGMNKFLIEMSDSNRTEILGTCSAEKESGNNSDPPCQSNYCRLCNIQFKNYKSYEKHAKKKKHRKTEQRITKISETKKENKMSTCNFEKSLQSLKYCQFCHAWFKNLRHYNNHLETRFHKRVKCLYLLIRGNDSALKEEYLQPLQTSKALVKLYSLTHHCESCNIVFDASEHFDQHLNSALHRRIEQFINEIRKIKPETNITNISDTPNSDNFCSLLPLLYYCELCNIWKYAARMYNHSNKLHRTIETYISNNNKQLFGITYPPFYCELCNIQFKNSKLYCHHLEGKFHTKVNSLVNRILNKK